MDLSKEEYRLEEQYLEKVYTQVQDQLAKRKGQFEGKKEEVMDIKKYIWTHNMDSAETAYFMSELSLQEGLESFLRTTTLALERMSESAYFGRLDFIGSNEKKDEAYYIGIGNLMDDESLDVFVYDWRTPFAGMYYDYESGPAEYEAPDGIVKGEITKKRQYKIENDKIKFVFDSDIKIEDEILQQALDENTNDKMKNIVTTIQKEQNSIIRNEGTEVLVVQGPAGSGKTSVALHRIAFLLYKHGKTMKFNNILIFSPNEVFMDYISSVLPEMGEQNVLQTTFNEYAISFLKDEFYHIESLNEQLEFIYNKENADDKRLDAIEFKMSEKMLDLLNSYVKYIEENIIKMQDITIHRKNELARITTKDEDVLVMTADEFRELYYKDYKHMPIINRVEKIIDRAIMLFDDGKLTKGKKNQIKKKLMKEIVNLNSLKLYKELFSDYSLLQELTGEENLEKVEAMSSVTLSKLKKKEIYYEDIAPLLYLQGMLEGFHKNDMIKHIVVDEAQDYSVVQYAIIKNVFKSARMTILGDINQSIHPYVNYKNYDDLRNIFERDNSQLMRLSKSFRSTSEITTLSRQILKDETIQAIERFRGKPEIKDVKDEQELEERLIEEIKKMQSEEMKSIGIICKSSVEAQRLYDDLKDKIDVDLITFDDMKFKHKVIILPSYLAKGLEFDGVILHDISEDTYREGDRKLFYTMCTRPLHRLVMFNKGEVNKYIKEIEEEYYMR